MIKGDDALARGWWDSIAELVPSAAGLWFGIVEIERGGVARTELYVAACSTFDPQDEAFGWAVDPAWMHPDAYVHLPGLASLGSDVTAQLAHAVEVVRSLDPASMCASGGVAVGFDDGDGEMVWAAPRTRTRRSPGWYRVWIGRQGQGGRVRDFGSGFPVLQDACDGDAPFEEVQAAPPDQAVFEVIDGSPDDAIWVFSNHALMSPRARQVVDSVCTDSDAICWRPVAVVDERGIEHPYFLLHVPPLDAIDYEQTRFMPDPPGPPGFIRSLCLDPRAVGGRNLFRLPDSSRTVIVSGAFKDAFNDAGCSGLSFERERTS